MRIMDQAAFVDIYRKCLDNNQTLTDISDIVSLVRYNISELSEKTSVALLKIPQTVLRTEVVLKEVQKVWAQRNSDYFSGNMVNIIDENFDRVFVERYRKIFNQGDFALCDIYEFISIIVENFNLLSNDFFLRIPEVVLRDDVTIKPNSRFKQSGVLYAVEIEQAFSL